MSTLLNGRPEMDLLPPEAGIAETVEWAVAHAVLAPSLMNSQPWLFRAQVDPGDCTARVDVYLDRHRVLPHVDPGGREATLACGAALLNLRLALRAAGMGATLRLAPDTAAPDRVAVVVVHGSSRERPDERLLREAIPHRATNRTHFDPAELSGALLDHLVAESAFEGALVAVLDEPTSERVRSLAARARRRSCADVTYAHDLAAWTRANVEDADDGLPGWVHGLGLLASVREPSRLLHGRSTVAADEARAESAEPGRLVVVGASGDDTAAVLRAGAGLQRMLLAATVNGVSARFLDEPLRYAQMRSELGRLVDLDHPQAVLHLGFDRPAPSTRRRPVDEVLTITTR